VPSPRAGVVEQLGSPAEFLRVPYGQSIYHMFRGELDLALRLAEDLLASEPPARRFRRLVLVHNSFGDGLNLCRQVCFIPIALEEVLALYDPPPTAR